MNRRTKWIATAAVAAAALAVGSGIAVASSAEDDDAPIPQGNALDRASAAALKEAGGGKVTGSEQEDGGYEIEVTRDDGTVLEVELDGAFEVVGTEADDDDANEAEDADEANEADDANETDEGSEGPDAGNE